MRGCAGLTPVAPVAMGSSSAEPAERTDPQHEQPARMRDPPSPDVSGASFREAMSRVAEQVHVIATDGPAGRAGATATAVASVSDAPPTLLVCLNGASATLAKIRANGRFSVNALPASARDIAGIFAGQGGLEGADRFREADGWRPLEGSPVLGGALAAFACRVAEARAVGSHVVVFGLVLAVATGGEDRPLLYHRRSYGAA